MAASAGIAAFPRAVVRFLVIVNRPLGGPKQLADEARKAQLLRVLAAVIALLAGLRLLTELS